MTAVVSYRQQKVWMMELTSNSPTVETVDWQNAGLYLLLTTIHKQVEARR